MSLNDLLTVVNSDPKTTLNHMIWLNEYKTYGENSYVFQDKRLWRELCCSPIAVNDCYFMNNTLEYLAENSTANANGVLSKMYGCDSIKQLDCYTLDEILGSTEAMRILSQSLSFQAGVKNSNDTFLNKYKLSNIDPASLGDAIGNFFADNVLILPFVRDIDTFKKCIPIFESVKDYDALYSALVSASFSEVKETDRFYPVGSSGGLCVNSGRYLVLNCYTQASNRYDDTKNIRIYYGGTTNYDTYVNKTTNSPVVPSKVMKIYDAPLYITHTTGSGIQTGKAGMVVINLTD